MTLTGCEALRHSASVSLSASAVPDAVRGPGKPQNVSPGPSALVVGDKAQSKGQESWALEPY